MNDSKKICMYLSKGTVYRLEKYFFKKNSIYDKLYVKFHFYTVQNQLKLTS